MTDQEHFDIKYMNNLLTQVSDETPDVPMATLKRMITIATEDGHWFRALTVLENLVMKIGNKIDADLKAVEDKINV